MSDTKFETRVTSSGKYEVLLDTEAPTVLFARTVLDDKAFEEVFNPDAVETLLNQTMETDNLTEDEAIEALNNGGTWAFVRKAQ